MTDTLGTARLDIVVDTTSMEAGVERAKRSVAGLSTSAQAEYAKLNASEKRRVDSLIRQADTLGLTRQQQIAYNATLKTSGTIQKELLERIRQTGEAVRPGANALNQYGISAKQTAAALRQVPAQITDIVVGLQSGQRPLTVLLQQGGQLKDVFGGIRPAAAALGSSLLALINPLTVTAAVAGALVLAWKQGSDEAYAYNKALIETGNYAGLTSSSMQKLAADISDVRGTQHEAAATLAEVASAGKFTAEQIRLVGRAAVATGRDVSDVVSEFSKLADEPVDAVVELNDRYHFLTAEIYDQIRALQDEGREREAATLAIQTYSDETVRRAGQVEEKLGALEKAWKYVGIGAKAAWDSMLNIGREQSLQDQLDDVVRKQQAATEELFRLRAGGAADASIRFVENRLLELQGKHKELVIAIGKEDEQTLKEANAQRAHSLLIAYDNEARLYDTREQKRVQEIEAAHQKANDAIAALQESQDKKLTEKIARIREAEAKIVAGIEEKYRERQTRKRTARKVSDPSDSLLQQLQRQIALNREAATSEDKLSASERLRVSVLVELERIGGKLSSQRKAEIDDALQTLQLTDEKVKAYQAEKKAKEELERLQRQIDAQAENRRASNEAELRSLGGAGRDELDRLERRLEIEREYAEEVARLRDRGVAEDSDSYRQQLELLRRARNQQLSEEEDFQRAREALQSDWRNGAQRALNNFLAESRDVASQVEDIWANAFSGLTDTLTDFVTKGKGDFRGFLDSLYADITRFVIKQLLSKWLESLAGLLTKGSSGSSSGDGIGNALGSVIGAAFGGGRAAGGPVSPGSYYEVGEDRPELLTFGASGRKYLIPGKDGQVTPIKGSGESFTQHVNITVQGTINRETVHQIARASGSEARRALARSG